MHLNPVRAGLAEMPGNYSWSSYRSYVGLEKTPRWLSTDLVLGFFGRENSTARKSYRSFVEDLVIKGIRKPLEGCFRFDDSWRRGIRQEDPGEISRSCKKKPGCAGPFRVVIGENDTRNLRSD
jgi:hypothetical protein